MTLLDLKDLETHLWEAAHIITVNSHQNSRHT